MRDIHERAQAGQTDHPEKAPPQKMQGDFASSEFYLLPGNFEAAFAELVEDLRQVPVRGENGEPTDVYKKIEESPYLQASDKDLIWRCLTVVRNAFLQLEETCTRRHEEKGYQWNMNWKHTRAEIDQVFEAAKLLKLDHASTRDALIASIFSDCVKSRRNFIVHNLHGAQAAEMVLSQLLDQTEAENQAIVRRVARAVKEHQIAPPEFMAKVVAIMISNRLALGRYDFENLPEAPANEEELNKHKVRQMVAEIFRKIKDPFNTENLIEDHSLIDFSIGERQLLVNIGIEDWFVPHPENADALIAHAVIAGDHSINYNHPEGFAKIALLRGPDTEEIFEDPTIHHSLDSAVSSFSDSFRVIKTEVQALAVDGLRKTMIALARANAVMNELFSGVVVGPRGSSDPGEIERVTEALYRAQKREPQLFNIEYDSLPDATKRRLGQSVKRIGAILKDWYDNYGEIPFSPKTASDALPGPGLLPFWNAPLKYPPRDEVGNIQLDGLTELELRQFKFAAKIREITVEMLRAESWVFGSL
jgi:hypothetical protein